MLETVIILFVLLIFLFLFLKHIALKKRKEDLMKKYGDLPIVEKIMRKEIWQGQTTEQLKDSRGKPEKIDERVLKKKTKHVFKYCQTGKGRYNLHVVLENGLVVGWDDKR